LVGRTVLSNAQGDSSGTVAQPYNPSFWGVSGRKVEAGPGIKSKTLSAKQLKQKTARGIVQEVEHLPNIHKALNSNPSTVKKIGDTNDVSITASVRTGWLLSDCHTWIVMLCKPMNHHPTGPKHSVKVTGAPSRIPLLTWKEV
jgi:hypothetical protein